MLQCIPDSIRVHRRTFQPAACCMLQRTLWPCLVLCFIFLPPTLVIGLITFPLAHRTMLKGLLLSVVATVAIIRTAVAQGVQSDDPCASVGGCAREPGFCVHADGQDVNDKVSKNADVDLPEADCAPCPPPLVLSRCVCLCS